MGKTRNLSNLVSDNIFSISLDGGIGLGGENGVGINTINVVGIVSASSGLYGDAPNANASGQAANLADSNTSFTTTGIVTTTKELVGDGRGISGLGHTTMSYVLDRKDASSSGGSMTDDLWQTRDLNYKIYFDNTDFVIIDNNTFDLTAGRYFIEWECPSFRVDMAGSRLYDATNTTEITQGQTTYSQDGNTFGTQTSIGAAMVTPTSLTTYRIDGWVKHNTGTYDRGTAGVTGTVSEFCIVKIYKFGA